MMAFSKKTSFILIVAVLFVYVLSQTEAKQVNHEDVQKPIKVEDDKEVKNSSERKESNSSKMIKESDNESENNDGASTVPSDTKETSPTKEANPTKESNLTKKRRLRGSKKSSRQQSKTIEDHKDSSTLIRPSRLNPNTTEPLLVTVKTTSTTKNPTTMYPTTMYPTSTQKVRPLKNTTKRMDDDYPDYEDPDYENDGYDYKGLDFVDAVEDRLAQWAKVIRRTYNELYLLRPVAKMILDKMRFMSDLINDSDDE